MELTEHKILDICYKRIFFVREVNNGWISNLCWFCSIFKSFHSGERKQPSNRMKRAGYLHKTSQVLLNSPRKQKRQVIRERRVSRSLRIWRLLKVFCGGIWSCCLSTNTILLRALATNICKEFACISTFRFFLYNPIVLLRLKHSYVILNKLCKALASVNFLN